MAYFIILNEKTKQQIGVMRLIDNKNIIFDMKGNKVGYSISTDGGEKFCDLAGNTVETVEELLLKE